jgi:hypothetical protein
MAGVGIDWGLAAPQPNALVQGLAGYQLGQEQGRQDQVRNAYNNYDPANPLPAYNALMKLGAVPQANALIQGSQAVQKFNDLRSLNGYTPATRADPFAAPGGASAARGASIGAPSATPNLSTAQGAGGLTTPQGTGQQWSPRDLPQGYDPSVPGASSAEAARVAALGGSTSPASPPITGAAPPSQDVTVTGARPSGYDFRSTLLPQDNSDPVLSAKLNLMLAHGSITKDQLDAYHQAYSNTPPAVKQAQQNYVDQATRIATQAADITGKDAEGDDGTVNADSPQSIAMRKAYVVQNYGYMKRLFMQAHPDADPQMFQDSIDKLDYSRNGMLGLANQLNSQKDLQSAIDNGDQGDLDSYKAYGDRVHQQNEDANGASNSQSNRVRANAASQTAGTYAGIAKQALGGGKPQPAPGGRIYGKQLPPGITLDPPPSPQQ